MPVRVAAPLLVLALLTVACSDSERPAPPPTTPIPSTSEPPTTVTTEPVTIPGRPRPTTTLPMEVIGGPARISGTVVGPSGPVTATVRVERLVGSHVATHDVVATNGSFVLANVHGGHYRVRAWNRPDLVQLEPEVFFLAADETKTLELLVTKVADVSLQTTVEPNPIPGNDVFTATVFVYAGSVSEDGTLQAIPRASLPVTLAVATGLVLQSPSTTTTDGSGHAAFRLRCVTAGNHGADLLVANMRLPLGLPPCPG